MHDVDLALPLSSVIGLLTGALNSVEIQTWAVFLMCLFFSIVGGFGSFLLLSSTLPRFKLWRISIIIAIGMIGLSYFQKYSNIDARTSFTPIDLITYLLQGFLWPTTWPTLASAIGVSSFITAPAAPTGTQKS